jgi:hypothetical protein
MTLSDLPAVNAALNTLSTIFLTCGYSSSAGSARSPIAIA